MPHQCTNCGRTFQDGSKEMLSGCPGCGGNKFQYLPADGTGDGSAEPPDRFEPSGPTGNVTERMARAATTVEEYVANRRADEARRADDAFFGDDDFSDAAPSTASTETEESASETDIVDGTTESAPESPEPTPPEESTAGRAETSESSGTERSDSSGSGMGDFEEFTDSEDLSKTDREAEDSAQASARGGVVDESDLLEDTDDSPPAEQPSRPPSEGHVVKEPTSESTPDLESLRAELNDQFESIKIVEPGQYELNLMELYDRQEYIISLKEDGKYVVEIPEAWEGTDTPESDET